MKIKVFRPKAEAKIFHSLNESIEINTKDMQGTELEFEDGSILLFRSNDLYCKIIANKKYYRSDKSVYEFDLDQFTVDFLINQDDLSEGYTYRNRNVYGICIYSLDGSDQIQACRLIL